MKSEKAYLINAGTLERLGLGKLLPLVKLNLDALNGDERFVKDEIEKLVEKIDGQTINASSSLPPLGDFQKPSASETPLSTNRLAELLRTFSGVAATAEGAGSGSDFYGLRRIYGAFNMLHGTFNNYTQFNKRASNSIFTNLRM